MSAASASSSTSKKERFSLVEYLRGAREEIKKVVWPTKKELYRHTWIVIAISLSVAVLLGVLDIVLQRVLQYVL